MRVIAIAGGIGSGKSTIATALANRFGCPIASFGAYVRNVAHQSGRSSERHELQRISEELISSLGPEELTRHVLAVSKWDRQTMLIVDGVRHPDVVNALRSEVLPLSMTIVYLDVPLEVRRARFVARDNAHADELSAFDVHSTERQVQTEVRALADVIVAADAEPAVTLMAVLRALGVKE